MLEFVKEVREKKLLTPNAIPDLLHTNKNRQPDDELPQTSYFSDNIEENCEENVGLENLPDDISPLEKDEINQYVEQVNDIEELKQKLKITLQKCRRYEKKLDQKNEGPLTKIFSEDQLKFLETKNCRGSS
ncbi:hypothetical protein ABEB36_015000 [Hypothenemus hampei]|uniref:Uncharacterized protein n=1 Tax=Hypothenemus hampei TaxID=57062 RepID=A0ABD1E2D7_HYPHA